MDRRTAAALGLAFATTFLAPAARAQPAPSCDAGAPCVDRDGDGFPSCTCTAPGVACDCDDADPSAFPGAPEACDAPKDLSCDGKTGEPCGGDAGCIHSMCAPECIPLDDFGCAPYAFCEDKGSQRLCVGRDCSVYGCPPGLTCDDSKTCVPNCNASVRCPFGRICRGLGCVDPCEGVTCGAGSACEKGVCVASCECPGAACAAGEACDRASPVPRCVEQACVGVTCAAGLHCEAGTCVDDCAGVVCPPERVCRKTALDGGAARGECVDLCAPDPCTLPTVCDWRTGTCLAATFPEAGLRPFDETDAAADAGNVYGGGGCAMTGLGGASATGAAGAALALLVSLVRRGSRRRARRSLSRPT